MRHELSERLHKFKNWTNFCPGLVFVSALDKHKVHFLKIPERAEELWAPQAGLSVHQNFVIPPLHRDTSCARFCIGGMRAAAPGERLETQRSLR